MDCLARNLRDLLDLVKEIPDKGCTIHFVRVSFRRCSLIMRLRLLRMWMFRIRASISKCPKLFFIVHVI